MSAGVPRLHAAPVLDPNLLAAVSAPPSSRERGADRPRWCLGVLRRGVAGRCRSPRSVRRRRCRAPRRRPCTPANAAADLRRDLGRGGPGLALLERLAHAEDRGHAVLQHRLELARSPSRRSHRRAARRSEWPTITYCTVSFASMGGLTSPVNAPWSSQWQFWAPRRIGMPVGVDRRLHRAQVGERRAEHDVDAVESSSSSR